MSYQEDFIAITMFENKIYGCEGQAFEDLFSLIMKELYSEDFQQVKPYGNFGDRKNDGYIKSTGTFFQLYAPSNIEKKTTIKNAINKLETDFSGLLNYWSKFTNVKNFYFVINDKFKGCDARIHETINKLQFNNKNINICLFTSSELLDYFRKLSIEKKYRIIGYINSKVNLKTVDLHCISKVIEHIINNTITDPDAVLNRLKAPDIKEKIKVNNLDAFGDFLIAGNLQYNVIDRYYSNNPEAKLVLQEKVISLYREKLKNNSNKDIVFAEMSKDMIPYTDNEEYNNSLIFSAIYVILAYFFQVCDIGDEPKKCKDSFFDEEEVL
ncbi:ABC-three component system protein [uncultured Brachyspira sp.]|uniref:ABC-three component system protein n=1 Tax=uncultured Brachyspira sp. TaxID=221953 RepID=UPI0032201C3A